MKVLILSSSPNVLKQYEELNKEYDITVGISTTNWYINCDYAAFIDSIALVGMIERGMLPNIGYVYTTPFKSKKEVETFPTIDGLPIRLTLPATYAWVIEKFGVLPDIIGNDRTSEANIGGLSANHSEVRWAMEDKLMELLKRDYYENN
jgi:hypothetical protein